MTSLEKSHFATAFLMTVGFQWLPSVAFSAARASDVIETQAVGFADLNLAAEAGQLAPYERITAAARHVCKLATQTHLVDHRDAFATCDPDAMRDALSQMRYVYANPRAPGPGGMLASRRDRYS